MKILDGKEVADGIKRDVRDAIKSLSLGDSKPRINLAVIQVGDNDASDVYIRNKQKACNHVGICMVTHYLDKNVSQEELVRVIHSLNDNPSVTGILVQMPLPEHIDENAAVNEIDPKKDVDGFTFVNSGKLARNCEYMIPCTPYGIIKILENYDVSLTGKRCVVVGRSNIVGRPMAEMLLNRGATVTVCHSKTVDLDAICREADILICAIGKPKFFNKNYINPNGSIVIDVGMNRDEGGKICGDVDFDDVKDMNGMITPVPGGTGPMTVAMLVMNCLTAYMIQHNDMMDVN